MTVQFYIYSEGSGLSLVSNSGVICDVFKKGDLKSSDDLFTCLITSDAAITPNVKIESGESFTVTLCGSTTIPFELDPEEDHLSA